MKPKPLSTKNTTDDNQIKDNQRFLSTLIANLPGYIYRCHEEDGDWCTQFASDGIYELTGYHATEFLKGGKLAFGELVYPDDSELVRTSVTEALHNQNPYQITYRIVTKDDLIKWVWEQGRGIYNEDGVLLATEGYIVDITEKKLNEEQIIKRNEELGIINHIGNTLNKLAKPDEIYTIMYEMLGKLFITENLYIAIYDEPTHTIHFPVYSIEGKLLNKQPRPFKNGLTEHVLNTKVPLLINKDINKIFQENNILLIGKPSKSVLSVPMIAGQKVLGVITIQDYNDENMFTQEQMSLLSTIASQSAIALENSRLYDAIENELIERKVIEEKIKKSLKEKEILLQEVHHRVKNNLQIMSSLLRLQSSYIHDPKVLDVFKESENRIKSMAIVHNKLYQSHDYERIDAESYIRSLVENLISTYTIFTQRVNFRLQVEKNPMNIETAIPCGLIINELVSNAIKYAFPSHEGIIEVSLRKTDDVTFELIVKDNGIGLPDHYEKIKEDSLGLKLVSMLIEQLNGKLTINNQKGTKFKILFTEMKYKPRT